MKFKFQGFLFLIGALGETRTRTSYGHYPLKIACLPIPPPELYSVQNNVIEECRYFDFQLLQVAQLFVEHHLNLQTDFLVQIDVNLSYQ